MINRVEFVSKEIGAGVLCVLVLGACHGGSSEGTRRAGASHVAESRTSEKAAGYTRPVDNLEPAEQAAIVTAKKYVGPKREVESCTMEREGDKFVVHLQFTSGPLGQDGNDCLVYVDKNGKVVDYFEGL